MFCVNRKHHKAQQIWIPLHGTTKSCFGGYSFACFSKFHTCIWIFFFKLIHTPSQKSCFLCTCEQKNRNKENRRKRQRSSANSGLFYPTCFQSVSMCFILKRIIQKKAKIVSPRWKKGWDSRLQCRFDALFLLNPAKRFAVLEVREVFWQLCLSLFCFCWLRKLLTFICNHSPLLIWYSCWYLGLFSQSYVELFPVR